MNVSITSQTSASQEKPFLAPPLNKVSENQILRATFELNGLNANWWQIKWQPVHHSLVLCETVCVVMNGMGQINQGPCIGNSL